MKTDFVNEPLTDFSVAANAQAFRAALDQVRAGFGRAYPLIVGGEKIYTDHVLESCNPADPSQVIGRVSQATPELADRAVREAYCAFEHWKRVPYTERARYLFHAAKLMRERKHEFSALMVFEAGKAWVEADADTAEAIDFMEFYGREMLRLGEPHPTYPEPNHDTELHYIPLGVGIVIPPWNFPCAIMTGMTTATIVTGNTAVLKPASATPVIAAWLAELFVDELHLPPGVLNYLPGPGGSVGDVLVDHPLDALHRIHRQQGSGHPHQPAGGRSAAGSEVAQADDPGDGRQGRDPGGRDGGPGGGGRRDRFGGVRLPGSEVLGLLASDHRRAGL